MGLPWGFLGPALWLPFTRSHCDNIRTMAGEEPSGPRSLVLTAQDRAIVVSRLARAVLRFQDSFLCSEGSPAGLLCQASGMAVSLGGAIGRRLHPAASLKHLHDVCGTARGAARNTHHSSLGICRLRCLPQVWLPEVVEDNQIVLKTKVGPQRGCPRAMPCLPRNGVISLFRASCLKPWRWAARGVAG